MDYLFNAIKNLSHKEVASLRKKIRTQSQKLRLLNLVQEQEDPELRDLMVRMGYGEKATGFYTLKNRLYEDVIDVKMEMEKNEVIITKEKVQNLRGLVYSRDALTLLRELRKLEKKCLELELFAELKEIYFCYLMIYRHDRKKVAHYKQLMEDTDFRQKTMHRLEELFYTKLLDTQDLFYYSSEYFLNEAREVLESVRQMDELLGRKSSSFLYLSAKLTIRLNYPINNESYESKDILKSLVQLHKLYHNSFLIYRYPNCDVAIQCLFSKYYYLTGNQEQFELSQKSLIEKINRVSGFKMFECTIFYFLYISVLSKVDIWNRATLARFLGQLLPADKIDYCSSKMKNYFYYLMAIKDFYSEDYNKSSGTLLRSRKYFTQLDQKNCWIAVENIILNTYNYTQTGDYSLIPSELNMLSRVASKYHLEEPYTRMIKDVIKVTRQCLSTKDFTNYGDSLARIKSTHQNNLYRLVSF